MDLENYKELRKCRYFKNLENVLDEFKAYKIIRARFEADYQGFVDVDVLLKDGRVFSYYYSYGSCSGCDKWEAKDFTGAEIEEIMRNEATIFDNVDEYEKYLKLKNK